MSSIKQNVIGAEEEILITQIEDKCLYGQLTKFPKHTLWQIHRVILASFPETKSNESPEIQPGSYVAVNVEDMFVRAVVLKADSPQYVVVHLLDIGTNELVHSYGIRPLSTTLDNFPRMAVNVVLREAATVATGEVRTLSNIELIAIRGEVHLLGTLSPSKSIEKREYARVPAFVPEYESYEVPQVPQPVQEQKPNPVVAPAPPVAIRETKLPEAKPKVPQALALGACQIEVVDASNGRTATVRRADSEKSLRILENKLVSFSSKYRAVSSVEVGDYLLALYGGEGHWWSRALVHEVTEDAIQVEYVDYAVYDFIPRTNIRELPRCFCQEAAHAATVDFNIDVEVDQRYNVVVTAKLDGHGRLFAGYVTEQLTA